MIPRIGGTVLVITAVPEAAVSLAWIIIDAGLPLLLGALGVSLLRGGRDR